MNYYEQGKREYPLEFKSKKLAPINRVGEILASKLVTPRSYGVEISSIMDAYESPGMSHSEISQDEFNKRFKCFNLEVKGFFNTIVNRGGYIRVVMMNLMLDMIDNKAKLYGDEITAWIKIGLKDYLLTYKGTGSEVMQLTNVREMSKYTGNIYMGSSDKPVSNRKLVQMDLPAKGFPIEVNWIETFKMYAQKRKSDGSQLFSAEDIHGQFLVPAK